MAWYSVRPLQIINESPHFFMAMRDVVRSAQQQAHPGEPVSDVFVLRANTGDTNSVYIHVGEFTPHAVERFTIRLLRDHINQGGAGVKPRGVEHGYQQGLLTPEHTATLVQALDYMADKTAVMQAEEDDLDEDDLDADDIFVPGDGDMDLEMEMEMEEHANDDHDVAPAA